MKKNLFSTLVLILAAAAFVLYNRNYYRGKDSLGPIIEMDSAEIYVSVYDPDQQPLAGMTATDGKDGDVTSLMLIENISDFVAENTRVVSYAAFDRDNHVSKAERRMIYTDYTEPVFSLSGPLRFPAASTRKDYLNNLTVTDCLDGNMSDQAAFTSDSVINTSVPGDYKVTVAVTNSAGDTHTLPVTLTVYDQTKESSVPSIALTDYLVYTVPGQRIDPISLIDHVTYRGTEYGITTEEGTFAVDTEGWSSYSLRQFREREPAVNQERFEITDLVNYQVPGVYEIIYSLAALDGGEGSVRLIVIVEE